MINEVIIFAIISGIGVFVSLLGLFMAYFSERTTIKAEYDASAKSPSFFSDFKGQKEQLSRLIPVTELKQYSIVGRHLQHPLSVQTVNSQGTPIDGLEVVFEVLGEGGYLVDKQTRYSVISNKEGRAEASFLLTGEVGKRTVVASINDNEHAKLEFQIHGIPGPPAKLVSVSGNHQSAATGQLIGKPFVVELSDVFGNAVKDSFVLFTITKGSGRFAHYNHDNDKESGGITSVFKKKFLSPKVTYETTTDSLGRAEASLVLGPLPGVNEVTAVAKGLSKSPVVFDAMAIERIIEIKK